MQTSHYGGRTYLEGLEHLFYPMGPQLEGRQGGLTYPDYRARVKNIISQLNLGVERRFTTLNHMQTSHYGGRTYLEGLKQLFTQSGDSWRVYNL